MVFEFPIEPRFYSVFAASVAMLLLGAWVFWLEPSSRVHRALAVLLLLRALFLGMLPFSSPFTDFEGRVRVYFALAIPFAALYLAYALRLRLATDAHGSPYRGHRAVPWALLAGALALEVPYFFNHALYGRLENGIGIAGPLEPFTLLQFALYPALALVLFQHYRTLAPGPLRSSWRMACLGFTLDPLYLASFLTADRLMDLVRIPGEVRTWYTTQPIMIWGDVIMLTALVLVGVWVVQLVRMARGTIDRSIRQEARRVLVILSLPLASGVVAAAFFAVNVYEMHFVLYGAWTLSFPLVLTYAILRYRLLGIELKVNWAIRKSTMASAFVAVFFIVSELTQRAVADQLGVADENTANYIGIAAAGLLLFALNPIERVAGRLADATVPPHKPYATMEPAERRDVYREHALIAWADGELSRRERVLLDRMRERLGLSPEDARRVEQNVAPA